MFAGVTVVEAAEYSGRFHVSLAWNRAGDFRAREYHVGQQFRAACSDRQGAKLVAGWQDVVEELPHRFAKKSCALVAQIRLR